MADDSEINLLKLVHTPSDMAHLIKFEASWCGPCKALNPVLQRVVDNYDDVLEVYTVDVDDNPEFANYFQVRSVPTTIYFGKDGKARWRRSGVFSYTQLATFLNLEHGEAS